MSFHLEGRRDPDRRERLLPLALAAVAIAFVLFSVELITPSYMVNDNIEIMDYAIHGLPISFIGVALTGFLHLLYDAAPELPWYGLTLYALHVLSIFLWLSLIFRILRPRWFAFAAALLFLGYYLPYLVFLDYTATSVMLCLSSLTWALLDVMERRTDRLRFLALGCVFLLGMLARPQGVLGALAYMLPIALMVALWRIHTGGFKGEIGKLALVAAIFFAPSALNFAADSAYRHYCPIPGQVEFDAFNAVRGRLQGLPRERELAAIRDAKLLDSIGWTRDQARNFFAWRFLDERVYTTAALQKLDENLPPPPLPFVQVLRDFASRLVPGPTQLLLLCPLPLFLVAMRKRRALGGAAILLPFYGLAIGSAMSVFMAFRERTEMPYLVGFGLACLLLGGFLKEHEDHEEGRAHSWSLRLACLIACIGVFLALQDLHNDHSKIMREAAATQSELDMINREFKGSTIVLQPDAGLQLASLNPLTVLKLDFNPINLGWSTFSPRFYQQLGPLGITHGYQLMGALVNRKDAYVLGVEWWAGVSRFQSGDKDMKDVQVVKARQIDKWDWLFQYQEPPSH